jgi:release factor glutamine methyltransferase
MTISIAEAILQGSHQLRKAGVPEARREAGSLIAHTLGRDRSFILTHAEDHLTEEQAAQLNDWLKRRSTGEPLQYITGNQEFFSLDFEVTRDVLIPRPETERLVETALKLARESAAPFICDVGTGSGCVVVSLLHELGESSGANAVALDVSPAALEVARRNAARHAVSERIEFIVSDCFRALRPNDPARPPFDLIVSNPPYISEGDLAGLQREVRDFEPLTALAAGPDGLDIIRRLLVESVDFLKTGGHFLFEIGYDQSQAVRQLIDPKIWSLLDIYEDLQGIPRTVALRKLS